LIKAFVAWDQRLHFTDSTDQLLTSDGMPDPSLDCSDKRHLNKKGYARWTAVIKPILREELGSKAAHVPQGPQKDHRNLDKWMKPSWANQALRKLGPCA
jgi:hypothetical protein